MINWRLYPSPYIVHDLGSSDENNYLYHLMRDISAILPFFIHASIDPMGSLYWYLLFHSIPYTTAQHDARPTNRGAKKEVRTKTEKGKRSTAKRPSCKLRPREKRDGFHTRSHLQLGTPSHRASAFGSDLYCVMTGQVRIVQDRMAARYVWMCSIGLE